MISSCSCPLQFDMLYDHFQYTLSCLILDHTCDWPPRLLQPRVTRLTNTTPINMISSCSCPYSLQFDMLHDLSVYFDIWPYMGLTAKTTSTPSDRIDQCTPYQISFHLVQVLAPLQINMLHVTFSIMWYFINIWPPTIIINGLFDKCKSGQIRFTSFLILYMG